MPFHGKVAESSERAPGGQSVRRRDTPRFLFAPASSVEVMEAELATENAEIAECFRVFREFGG